MWLRLYLFSWNLGLNYMMQVLKLGYSKIGLTRILIPMDIARYFEIPETLRHLKVKKGEKVFDLSSPKLLAVYLAREMGAKVVATDIWEKEIDEWKRLTDGVGWKMSIKWKVEDGRKISYKNNSFDKVYSTSVVEHIEGKGDTKAVKEMARILRPGGRLVLTVPVSTKFKETYIKKGIYGEKGGQKKYFWARRYDRLSLNERLIKPSGLRLIRVESCEERWPTISEKFGKFLPWSSVLGIIFPIIAAFDLKWNKDYEKEIKNGNALIVLEKPKK